MSFHGNKIHLLSGSHVSSGTWYCEREENPGRNGGEGKREYRLWEEKRERLLGEFLQFSDLFGIGLISQTNHFWSYIYIYSVLVLPGDNGAIEMRRQLKRGEWYLECRLMMVEGSFVPLFDRLPRKLTDPLKSKQVKKHVDCTTG